MAQPTPFRAIAFRWAYWERSSCSSAGLDSIPVHPLDFTGAFRNLAVIAAINTLMAGAAGGVSAMTYVWLFGPTRKPDPGMSVNGILAGLVAITAPCAFVDSWAAVVIGLIAGVIVCWATVLLEKWKIDDPVGAVPVHFFNGLWGVLAVGIFANGNPETAAWNGVESAVTGLLYGGTTQIFAQLAEIGSIVRICLWSLLCILQSPGCFETSARFPGCRIAGPGSTGNGHAWLSPRLGTLRPGRGGPGCTYPATSINKAFGERNILITGLVMVETSSFLVWAADGEFQTVQVLFAWQIKNLPIWVIDLALASPI